MGARGHAYTVYLAADASGISWAQLFSDCVAGTNQMLIPAETSLASFLALVVDTASSLVEQTTPVTPPAETTRGSFSDLVVYTASLLVGQTTPASFCVSDTVASVRSVSCPGFDLDDGDIGGFLSWDEAWEVSEITRHPPADANPANFCAGDRWLPPAIAQGPPVHAAKVL